MEPQRIIDGTGEEIARYAQAHPSEKFRLILLPGGEVSGTKPSQEAWEESMRIIHSFAGKACSLPLEETSTEALYSD